MVGPKHTIPFRSIPKIQSKKSTKTAVSGAFVAAFATNWEEEAAAARSASLAALRLLPTTQNKLKLKNQ